MNKPYSAACDNNREPIFTRLGQLFADRQAVLEIGSGSGQHAVYFAARLPHLTWYCSDLEENHAGIRLWLEEACLDNTPAPLALDVRQAAWPTLRVDAVFSANAIHIMDWQAVQAMFAGVGALLPAGGLLVLYGPFNYGGDYTSESNARFDCWLKERDPQSAIRDFEAVDRLAGEAGMHLLEDCALPANNRLLCWTKQAMIKREETQ